MDYKQSLKFSPPSSGENYKLPDEVNNILDKFIKAGYQIFIVGGSVRDLIMGRKVHDWDFTTDAEPEEILKIFPDGFYDNKFGTVGISIERDFINMGGASRGAPSTTRNEVSSEDVGWGWRATGPRSKIFEITTMRKEGKYKDFRHPEKVEWTNRIEEDLARRDFTVNSIALSITSPVIASGAKQSQNRDRHVVNTPHDDEFILVDPFNGQADIKNKIIKAVGNPDKRFKEDALRLMRAIRFASQLGFEIEKNTFEAIIKNTELIKEVSGERIRDELFKLLDSTYGYIGIKLLKEAGILKIILPEVEDSFGISQEGPKHARTYDIGEHSLLTLENTPSDNPLVRFAALIHDIGKVKTVKIAEDGNVTFYNHEVVSGRLTLNIAHRLNLSKKETDKLYRLTRWHQFSVDEYQTDSAIRRFIKNVGLENIEDMMALRVGDRLGGGTQNPTSWRMEKFQERIKEVLKKPFSISDLKINGEDVMKTLNIPPSLKVGEVLNKLFAEVLKDASKNNRDYLIEKIKNLG